MKYHGGIYWTPPSVSESPIASIMAPDCRCLWLQPSISLHHWPWRPWRWNHHSNSPQPPPDVATNGPCWLACRLMEASSDWPAWWSAYWINAKSDSEHTIPRTNEAERERTDCEVWDCWRIIVCIDKPRYNGFDRKPMVMKNIEIYLDIYIDIYLVFLKDKSSTGLQKT